MLKSSDLGPSPSIQFFLFKYLIGATKSEILHFLADAKLRLGGRPTLSGPATPNVVGAGTTNEMTETEDLQADASVFLGHRNNKHRISAISIISDSSSSSNDSSGDGSVLWRGPLDKMVRNGLGLKIY